MQILSKFTILLLICATSYTHAQQSLDLDLIKQDYSQALNDETKARALFETLSAANSQKPCIMAYEGGINALMCQYIKNPVKRLKLAKNANRLINEAVEKAPTDLDVRFMRLAFQTKTPRVLGYSKHLVQDSEFITQSLIHKELPISTISYMYVFMETEAICSPDELAQIKERILLAKN